MASNIERNMGKVPLESLIQEYVGDMQLRNLSSQTVRLYAYTLGRLVTYLRRGQPDNIQIPTSALTAQVVKAYVTARREQATLFENHPLRPMEERPLSKATLHQEIRIFRSFGSWLQENHYPNPFAELKLPKLPKNLIEVLTEEEVRILFSIYNPDTHFGARWQAMFAFFLDTGVRVGELVTLTLDHIDLQNFRAKVVGKGDKERYVIFGNRTHRLLSRYFNIFRGNGPSPYAFLTLEGEGFTIHGVQSIVGNARRKSRISRLHCHLFRHTFATNFLLMGGNAFELQALLGHESLEMTKRYAHLAQQLSRAGGSPIELRRPSPLDVMEKGGIRFDVPRGRGGRQRGASGRFQPHPG
jgi:site-specific recombinase XerD